MTNKPTFWQKWSHVYWLVGFIGLFLLVPELISVFNSVPGDTFSESWWMVFHTNDTHAPAWLEWGGRIFAIVLGGWLIGHLGFGLWGGPTKFPKFDLSKIEPRPLSGMPAHVEGLRPTPPEIRQLVAVTNEIALDWPGADHLRRAYLARQLTTATKELLAGDPS